MSQPLLGFRSAKMCADVWSTPMRFASCLPVHLCPAEWWCDVDWTTSVASAGIRVASKLILLGSRLDHAQTVPPVAPWAFGVVLERAVGLPAFGVGSTHRAG